MMKQIIAEEHYQNRNSFDLIGHAIVKWVVQ